MKDVINFAKKAHEGQKRKYTSEPYITHPVSVSKILKKLHPEATDSMVYAAILHDTVEDTEVTIDQIREQFGDVVADFVYWLTDQSLPSDGNRAARKAIDREHTAKAPANAQIIKLADLIDNSSSIVTHDKKFARVYLKEKALILDALRDEVKETDIYQYARAVLKESEEKLNE